MVRHAAIGNIAELFSDWARRTPHAPAVIDSTRVVSYRDLEAAMLRLAARFAKEGWGPGAVVAVALGRAPAAMHLAATLALARIGAVHLHLSPDDTASGDARDMVERHHAHAVVTARSLGGKLGVTEVLIDASAFDPSVPVPDAMLPTAGGDAPWIIVRSTGTTGKHKAFSCSHAVEFARQEHRPNQIRLAPGERTMSLVPFGFNLGLRWALRALWDGATVVALTPKLANAQGVFDTADRHGITAIMATPRHLSLLLDGFKGDGLRLPHLRCLAVTSAALSEPVFAGVRRRISPNILLIYGTNETWCIAAATADLVERHPGTVGYLTENVALEIVDRESLVPLPPGTLGEVRLRSPGMIDGYIDNPEADAKHFRDGWFYPGDAGLISSDGLVYLKGRSDEVLNFDGMLVGPQDIENVALQFPGISEAVAFGVPSKTRGDLPFLAVVCDAAVDAQALLAHCRAKLGGRAPVRILQVDALPRNSLGKVLRRQLAQLALQNIAEEVRRQ